MEEKIIQIIPVKRDTYALFRGANGAHYHAPVIAWALVSGEGNGAPALKGMTALGRGACSLADADPHFVRYVHSISIAYNHYVKLHPDLMARPEPEYPL